MNTNSGATGKEVFDKHGLHPEMPRVFDNSISSDARACERLVYQRYVLARQPTEKNHSLIYGSTWHKIHEIIGRTGNAEEAFAAIDEGIPEQVDDRYGRTRDRMKEAFTKYFEKYAEADAQTMELIRVELPWEVNCLAGANCVWGGCDLFYGGKMDRLYRRYDKLWLLDFKTSAFRDDRFAEKQILDSQTLGYAWGASHLVGEKVWGVIIDRVVMNKSALDFQRYPLAIPDALLLEWIRCERDTQQRVKELFGKYAYDLEGWRQNSSHCFAYGRACIFHSAVCTVPSYPDSEARLKQLEANFEENRWDFYNV